jgi:anaerobic magnesium-protoporphyrin IX monomethyl ester cyclase
MGRIALIGSDQQDNLPLRYLAAAVERAGHEARLFRFNHRRDEQRCIEAVLAYDPNLTGLGIAFQHAVNDYLHLAAALRQQGLRGHLTCGGHVPTFCFKEILEETSAIDTVIRHEGEHALVELLETCLRNESFEGIKGLVWRRDGEVVVAPPRPPVTDLDTLAPPKLRDTGPLAVGGVPIAFIVSARGCFGKCNYCSIQAFSRDAGGPKLRFRGEEEVADEVAAHYRRFGIRTFFFQDDLFILPNQRRTLKRMANLKQALDDRGVVDPIFWVKGRPESITEDIAREASRLGVVHIFVGVESASNERLAYLGRTHQHAHNIGAIEVCEANGIRPSFNLMLFDPDCTVNDVVQTLDFAAEVPHLPWNVCRTEIYSGTPLLKRLEAERRLEGNYRNFGYRMRDTACEIMFRILRVSFHERAFAVDSLLNKLISISFSRQVHEAFFPGPATDAYSRDVDQLLSDVHLDSIDELRRTLDYAAAADSTDTDAIREFAVASALRINMKNKGFYARFRQLWSLLNARGNTIYPLIGKPKLAS